MRQLTSHQVNGCNEQLYVESMDEPGIGGACHVYQITTHPTNGKPETTRIKFQNGAIKEVGTNGITHEALLAIVIDRLKGFQSGKFACPDNQEALDHLAGAMAALKRRTLARLAAGIEGTHQVGPATAEPLVTISNANTPVVGLADDHSEVSPQLQSVMDSNTANLDAANQQTAHISSGDI